MKVLARGHFSIALLLTMPGCSAPGVPRDASWHWSFEDGFYWTWKRPANSGCISWMAVEGWASVDVSVNTPCNTVPEIGHSSAKGLSYLSFEDKLIFNNYWAWTPEIYDKLMVYDKRGMVAKTLPCPNVLTHPEIAEMRATASALAGSDLTDAEKRVLARIVERLSRVDGRSLSSLQDGCSDWHDDEDARQKVDPWSGKKFAANERT